MIKFSRVNVRIKLLEKMLGTAPVDEKIYETYIAQKMSEIKKKGVLVDYRPNEQGELIHKDIKDLTEEELKSIVASKIGEKGWSTFHRDPDKGIFVYDYWIKGFIKSSFNICQVNGTVPKVFAYKKWLDNLIFVYPRQIFLGLEEPDGDIERSLRFDVRGIEMTALARSHYIDEGREFEFQITLLDNPKMKEKITWDGIKTCFEFGQFVGLGQWRGSGGYGRFQVIKWEEVNDEVKSKKKNK